MSEPHELTPRASEKILETPRDEIYVSGISLWEFCMMVSRGRIDLNQSPLDWLKASSENHGVQVKPITPEIAHDSCLLSPFQGDPADRLITATARASGLAIVTKDRKIRDFSGVETVW